MIIILLFFANAFAAQTFTLKVDSPKFSYSMKINKTEFEYQSPTRKLKKPIEACEVPTFEKFANKIINEIKTDMTKSKKKVPSSIQVSLNKERHYFLPLSSAGISLAKVETDVDYIISEAAYRCSKK